MDDTPVRRRRAQEQEQSTGSSPEVPGTTATPTPPYSSTPPNHTSSKRRIPLFVPLSLLLIVVLAALPSNRTLLSSKLPPSLGSLIRYFTPTQPLPVDSDGYRLFTYSDVSKHDTYPADFYFVVDGYVINGTSFADVHRGGDWVLSEVAGKDATDQFYEQWRHHPVYITDPNYGGNHILGKIVPEERKPPGRRPSGGPGGGQPRGGGGVQEEEEEWDPYRDPHLD